MVDQFEKTQKKVEKKIDVKPVKATMGSEEQSKKLNEEIKADVEASKEKTEEQSENKTEEKSKETKKKEPVKVVVRDKAIANAFSLQISPKFTKAICKMIRRKDPNRAIAMLELVIQKKLPVKMTGLEVAHQKGKGISGARFPVNAAKAIIGVVEQLKANAVVNGIEEPIISIAMSNQASAPFKRGGRKAKRTNLHLEAVERTKLPKLKK